MLLPLLLSSLVGLASAAIVAIDDRDAAWSFSPESKFGEFSKDFLCPDCTSNPDATRPTATLHFTGVGVTLYTICPGGNHYSGHFSLKLDGQPQDDFKEQPSGCSEYKYKYQVYTVSGLKNGTHTISITNVVDETASKKSNLLIDYAEVDDGKSTETASNDAAKKTSMPIAAIVVPVLIIVSLSIVGMIYLVIRKKRQQRTAAMYNETVPVPYKAPNLHDPENNIPMAVYLPGHRAPPSNAAANVLARVQAAGNDPELEAALQIIASRTRNPAAPVSPPSPNGPSAATAAWARDRKGNRSNPSSQNTTPQNSDLGANWSLNAAPASTIQRSVAEDAIPPAYTDAMTRR
ncbi:hypothetical protein BKA62DRAFT_725704 [Auriculariales sp. MPI-PUGE-AT-0066]|nr:hypothetical protein BKA62DRAFT_725704 [Auriculariales sp. MPI-PUGE-AT-0066]